MPRRVIMSTDGVMTMCNVGRPPAYDIHPPSKLDLEREVLACADADFERLFGAD